MPSTWARLISASQYAPLTSRTMILRPLRRARSTSAVDHERAALLIGLHDEADAVPAGQLRVERQRFQQIEREFEPVGFLGIDIEADVVALREQQQLLQRAAAARPSRARAGRGCSADAAPKA